MTPTTRVLLPYADLQRVYRHCLLDSGVAMPWLAWDRVDPRQWRGGWHVKVDSALAPPFRPYDLLTTEEYAWGPTFDWRALAEHSAALLLQWVSAHSNDDIHGWYGGVIYGSREYVNARWQAHQTAISTETDRCIRAWTQMPICAPGRRLVGDVFTVADPPPEEPTP